MGLASGGEKEGNTTNLKPDNQDYGTFGVRAKRTDNPINPAAIDRQRKYTADGPAAGANAVNRRKTPGGRLGAKSPTAFKVRARTKKYY